VEDRTLLDPLETYYGLKSDFPLTRQLIARNSDAILPKRLYFVSQAIIDLLVRDEKEQLKVIATGLKVFERQDVKEGLAEGAEPMCR
jgi:multisite-specific tRNA:(cytosine-C5)-methyltransferase